MRGKNLSSRRAAIGVRMLVLGNFAFGPSQSAADRGSSRWFGACGRMFAVAVEGLAWKCRLFAAHVVAGRSWSGVHWIIVATEWTLMQLLLTGLAILAASGLASLVLGRWSRLANVVGATGAVAGSLLGFLPALSTLVSGDAHSKSWPWDVPYGSFSIELDPLSALFVVIVLGLTGLVAIHAAGYLDLYHAAKIARGPLVLFQSDGRQHDAGGRGA